MLTSVELLREGRALIEGGWCQKSSARDAKGISVPFGGKEARSFCASGALCHLMNAIYTPWQQAIAALKAVTGAYNIAAWNDVYGRTKEEVLDAFNRAIQYELDRIETLG